MNTIKVKRVVTIGHYRDFVTCGIFRTVEEAIQDVDSDIENELSDTFDDDYEEEYPEQTEEYRSCLNKDEIEKALENGSGSIMIELPNGTYYDIQWAETEIDLSEISTDILEVELKRRAELKSETQPQAENAALSDAEYVEKGGSICPSCGSANICTTSSMEVDGGSAWQNCKCNDCDAEWNDVYSLKGYDNLERGAE